MTMKKINWWQVLYEVVKVILLALAGGNAAVTML